ncbi:hypothetical protein LY90DRAFT_512688 [Neocallimastix californiae]|uniref:G-protein coupled receptors family 3 profile domain-containing protein n=1 Tax=Neocallimastix californiae TaxID=1754190 RepID=A0A1Y2B6V4_9FUNG|nr:hypothetical protein LY90DRAFT_512688 [Neocallimastix californiae]|eukprot:ORY30270.1 hypothetical protein LY90DRAFT_512688 [Neocallimastix californiae]
MKIFCNYIVLIISFLFISFSQSEKTVINILAKQPDMPETANAEEWEINYENLINSFLAEQSVGNPALKDVEISFSFYEYLPMKENGGSMYFGYLYEISPDLDDGIYDMMILDDRILFSEMSFMESDLVETYFYHRLPSIEIFHPLSEYVKKEELSFNNERTLRDGIYEGTIYGLPYEFDFDVLYYDDQNVDSINMINNMKEMTWDDLLTSIKSSTPNTQSIGLGDDNNLLDLLMEYASSRYQLTKKYDPLYYEIFYNKTGEEFFSSFYNFMIMYTNGNVDESIRITLDDAFADFKEKKSMFFKGKASHCNIIRSEMANTNSTFSYTLPPKYKTSVIEKFLAVNTNSKLDKNLLAEVALALTSKQAQLLRANKFGAIPTFDITKKDSIPEIKTYCTNQPYICDIIEKMDRVYIKDILKNEKSSPFVEIESFLPRLIRSYLDNSDIDGAVFAFKNIFTLLTDDLGIFKILSYIIVIAFSLFFLIIIFLIYKHKEHPYIKVISPIFCIMIIIGTTMNMCKYLQYVLPYTAFMAKFWFIYETITINLIYVPMFAVTYRIYRIFKTNLFMTNALDNKRLFIGISSVILAVIAYRAYIASIVSFYYLPIGSLRFTRFPVATFEGGDTLDNIYIIYLYGIFIALLFMMINTGRISRKFGDISYIFVIFILNISDFIVTRLLEKLSHINYPRYFFLIMLFNCLVSFFCIHLLIGSRLLFVLMFPDNINANSILKSSDLKEFVPLTSRKKYNKLLKKFKENISISFKSKKNSSVNNLSYISKPYNVNSRSNKNYSLYTSANTGLNSKLNSGFKSPNNDSVFQAQNNISSMSNSLNHNRMSPNSQYFDLSTSPRSIINLSSFNDDNSPTNYNFTSPFLNQKYNGYSPNSQQYSPNSQQFSPNNQQFSPNNQQFSPNNQQFSPNNQQFSPNNQQFSPNSQQFSPNSQQFSPNNQQHSPNNQQHGPNSQQHSPNNQQHNPYNQQFSPNN